MITPMFAILDDLGFQEIFVIMIAAVLFWGKRLPEVASQAGAQLAKFKRSLQDLKTETGIDHEVRKLQRTLEDAIPRDISIEDMARAASAKIQERRVASEEEARPKSYAESAAANVNPPAVNPPVVESPALPAAKVEPEPARDHDPNPDGSIPRAS
jgi:Sec-independent protein translocase protein TatA